jgi:hypothetical protein
MGIGAPASRGRRTGASVFGIAQHKALGLCASRISVSATCAHSEYVELFARKDPRNALVLADPFGCVNSPQEGKLAGAAFATTQKIAENAQYNVPEITIAAGKVSTQAKWARCIPKKLPYSRHLMSPPSTV